MGIADWCCQVLASVGGHKCNRPPMANRCKAGAKVQLFAATCKPEASYLILFIWSCVAQTAQTRPARNDKGGINQLHARSMYYYLRLLGFSTRDGGLHMPGQQPNLGTSNCGVKRAAPHRQAAMFQKIVHIELHEGREPAEFPCLRQNKELFCATEKAEGQLPQRMKRWKLS